MVVFIHKRALLSQQPASWSCKEKRIQPNAKQERKCYEKVLTIIDQCETLIINRSIGITVVNTHMVPFSQLSAALLCVIKQTRNLS